MSDAIDRLNAALEGRYRIESELGEGGMATVYLAEDIRHKRRVALKVLKPELAAVVGGERFLAEIETTANLQHPHILPLFDSGEADGFLFYVMPYVEGESLREKLERERQLPVDEALDLAEKTAAALQYAHEQGVVHRDIKPANILLSRGEPLVADFGIALALSEAGGGRITETGLSLGTPHYMSPEQAAGERTLDKRSDVYALGCILYETLCGEPPFSGATAQAVLAGILTGAPKPPRAHRKSIPVLVEDAILKALEKLPADRFDSAASLVSALRTPSFRAPKAVRDGTDRPARGRPVAAVAVVAGLLLAAGMAVGWLMRSPEAEGPILRYALELPAGQELAGAELRPRLALSPDGVHLAYVGEAPAAVNQLWVRARHELESRPVQGATNAHAPFFSPDGRSLGFVQPKQGGAQGLMIASLEGRPPVLLVDSLVGQDGAMWGDDGFIYYDGLTAGGTRGIMRVSAAGGEPEQVTTVDTIAGETDHVWPWKLPGVDALLYTVVRGGLGNADIGVESLDGTDRRLLVRGVTARYVESGYLVWVTIDGVVMGARFDRNARDIVGEPVELIRGLNVRIAGSTDLTVSASGRLAYFQGAPGVEQWEPVNVDRNGNALVVDPEWAPDMIGGLALSPDERRLVVSILDGQWRHLWVKELPRGPLTRLTSGSSFNGQASWTPDATEIIYISAALGGRSHARAVRPDGGAPPDTLLVRPNDLNEILPSADGLLVFREDIASRARIGYVRRGMPPESATVLDSESMERGLALSPDGRWLAYVTEESGLAEVFVRPFPGQRARRLQVSTAGGTEPAWSTDGRELFYRDGDGWMTAATLSTDPYIRVIDRERLFDADPYRVEPFDRHYDVRSDGRFVMLRSTGFGQTESGSLVLVENWFTELEERLDD